VRFEDDGSAVIGVDDAYGDALGPVDSAEFPGAFEQINQGSACVRLTTKDGLVHVVWCPLSGVVVESNAAVGQGAQGRSESGQQYRGPWLVRIWPQNQEEEAGNLKPYAG
jgi:glycine cleavage system H lipoate-binding protein